MGHWLIAHSRLARGTLSMRVTRRFSQAQSVWLQTDLSSDLLRVDYCTAEYAYVKLWHLPRNKAMAEVCLLGIGGHKLEKNCLYLGMNPPVLDPADGVTTLALEALLQFILLLEAL